MNMKFKILLTALVATLLAACASTPQQRFASSVQAAHNANRPVVVYQFAHTRVVERIPFRSAQKFDAHVGVAVINTAQQPIQKLVFKVADYRGNQPILSPDGKLVEGELVVTGPFEPGSSYGFVSKTPIWTTTVASNDSCPRLTGIEVVYQDGSNVEVARQNVGEYLTPQINVNCANSIPYNQYHEVFGTGNPTRYAPGFQGNPDVTHGVGGP